MKNLRKKRNLEKVSNTLKAKNLSDILSGIIVCGRIESKKTLGKRDAFDENTDADTDEAKNE